jgi:hypothetical protein
LLLIRGMALTIRHDTWVKCRSLLQLSTGIMVIPFFDLSAGERQISLFGDWCVKFLNNLCLLISVRLLLSFNNDKIIVNLAFKIFKFIVWLLRWRRIYLACTSFAFFRH